MQAMKLMASLVYLISLYILMLLKRYAFWYLPPGAKKNPTNNANRNHYLPITSKVFSYRSAVLESAHAFLWSQEP